MKNCKKELIRFGVWLRNGTAFCTTWFLILSLAYSHIRKQPEISVDSLTKMLVLTIGGVLIFNLFFTRLFIKRMDFTKRLTGFMLSIGVYECTGFYWIGLFKNSGTLIQWLIFIGIICALYFCCIGIYKRYSKKQGEIYTEALQKYQRQRNLKNEQ